MGGRQADGSELVMSSEKHPDAAESVTHSRQFASLYGELRQLAERQLRRNAGAPVSPTTLLHEAYLGMRGRDAVFPDREKFIPKKGGGLLVSPPLIFSIIERL